MKRDVALCESAFSTLSVAERFLSFLEVVESAFGLPYGPLFDDLMRTRPVCVLLNRNVDHYFAEFAISAKYNGYSGKFVILARHVDRDIATMLSRFARSIIIIHEHATEETFCLALDGLRFDLQRRDHRSYHSARTRFESLTRKEKQIFYLIARGKTSEAIAGQLGNSPRTIDTHRVKIHSKLETSTPRDLLRLLHILDFPL